MFGGWRGPVQAPRQPTLTRAQQIDTLRAAQPFAAPVPNDPNSFDIGLMRWDNGVRIRIRTTLPEGFPESGAPPIITVVEQPAKHPWLDSVTQRVIGSPELNNWNRNKSLGEVVSSIMLHFSTYPPSYTGAASNTNASVHAGGNAALGHAQQQQQQSGRRGEAIPPIVAFEQQQQRIAPPPGRTLSGNNAAVPPRVDSQQQQQQSRQTTSSQAGEGVAPPPRSSSSNISHTAMPPVPSSFAELRGMSLEELRVLQSDPNAIEDIVLAQESLTVFSALAASQREETLRLAQENLALEASLTALKEELAVAQRSVEAKAVEVAALQTQRATVLQRYTPARIAKELQLTAQALDDASEEISFALTDADAPPLGSSVSTATTQIDDTATSVSDRDRVGAGSEASGAAFGHYRGGSSGSAFTGGQGSLGGQAGAPTTQAVTAAVREIREQFVSLRTRYHAAMAKAEIVAQGGLQVPSIAI